MKKLLPPAVLKVLQDLQKKGFEAYIVGGAVRDLVMARKTYDWDFTTNASPSQILQVFPDGYYDNKFGTVGLTQEGFTRPFEITTYRSQEEYKDSRHPETFKWGKTLDEDLKRRDFTINALALQFAGSKLQVIDLYNGQEDIKQKLIRAVGDANLRFTEDALRMMRAIRIAAELRFSIEEKTLAAISKNSSLLAKISAERIRDELFKILKSAYPQDGIKLLFSSGLLAHIIPELIPTQGVAQAGHHTMDVWNHSLASLANCPSPDPVVRLATLLHDIGKAKAYRKTNGKITFYGHEVISTRQVQKIAERLKLSGKDKDKLLTLVRYHMFAYQPEMTDAAIRRFIKKVGLANINDMIMLRIGDRLGGGSRATSWRLREFQERIGKVLYTPMQVKDLKVNGKDVMTVLGIKPGPRVGEVLAKLFDEVMEESAKNDREYLLKRIKQLNLGG